MKYFVVSDIHGHFDKLIKGLDRVGFDVNNDNHTLVVCGDMFDRGTQSKEIYQYLKELNDKEKAIVIKGNHELFWYDLHFVDRENVENLHHNILFNGFHYTLQSFLGNDYIERLGSWNKVNQELKEKYPDLVKWIFDLPYYYETDNYIFTHAGIDIATNNWRDNEFWYETVWQNVVHFFKVDLKILGIDKKVVCGHYSTNRIRNHFKGDKNDYSIYHHHDNQKIGVDSGSYSSSIDYLDVLVIED